MPNGVWMVGAGHLEKLLKVIDRLLHLALEVPLINGNEVLIRIIDLLVIVTLIIASCNRGPLGLPLWPPLVAFGAPLCAFVSYLGGAPQLSLRTAFPSP
jgi:hypothetical protein